MSNSLGKPPRTLGLSLAIISSVVWFSVFPIAQLVRHLTFQSRLQMFLSEDGQSYAVGSDIYGGLDDITIYIQAVLGVLFLVIAVFAWIGRPPKIRFVMVAATVLLMLLSIGLSLAPLFATPSFADGFDSGQDLQRSLLGMQICGALFIPLYAVWYMNRGPARAFYRGYYLTPPDAGEVPEAK